MAELAPTKGNLLAVKRSRGLAMDGYELMDKKRNILVRELVALIDQAKDIQERIDSVFADAYAALKLANISLGSCDNIAGAISIDNSVNLLYRSVMGVEIPTVLSEPTKTDELPYGLVDTTSALDEAYIKFNRAKILLRDLSETENAIFRLAYSIRKTQKRSNALKNIVLPGLDATIIRISDSLEEKDREEFVRLKVIKANKQ